MVEGKPPQVMYEAEDAQQDDNACERAGIRRLQGTLIGRVWPGERVVLGMRTCRWLRRELRENAEKIVLKGLCHAPSSEGLFLHDICRFQNQAAALELHSLSLCPHLEAILDGAIAAGQRRFPSLASLDLKQCHITDQISCKTGLVLALHSHLTSLSLNGVGFELPRVQALANLGNGLRSCHSLTHLDLARVNLGTEPEALALLAALAQHTALEHLDLGENNLCDGVHVAEALSKSGACRFLALNGNQLGEEGASRLANALQHCSALEHLDLGGNGIFGPGAAAVASSISRAGGGRLVVLKLAGNGIGDAGVVDLSELLRTCSALRQLDLSTNRLTLKHLELIMEAVSVSGGRLEGLELRENDIRARAAVVVSIVLGACSALQLLDLSANALDSPPPNSPEQEQEQRQGLREYTALMRLELSSCGVGAEGAGELAGVVVRCPRLERVSVMGNRLGLVGARALGEGLRGCGALRSVELTGCKVGGEGMAALAAALSACAGLESLWLGRNEAGDRGVEAVAGVLGGWRRLQELSLRDNKVAVRGAVALAGALAGCGALRMLDLARNELGQEAALELGKGLGGCSSLTHLILRGNELGAEGARSLAEGVRGRCEALRHLDLRSNEVGKEGAERVVELLRLQTSMTCLDLRCNNKAWF